MDLVNTMISNYPNKRTPVIKMIILGCHVESIHLDSRIGEELELNVEFFLSLPQHAWDLASEDLSLFRSAAKSSATGTIQSYASNGPRIPKRKKLIYTDAKDRPNNDTENPRGGKAETDHALTVPAENDIGAVFSSPGMKKLFKKNVGTNTGYYGKLNFFDAQSYFDQIFGTQLKICHTFENDEDARDTKRVITRFIDDCRLYIFIAVCMMDYVGTDNYDITFYVQ